MITLRVFFIHYFRPNTKFQFLVPVICIKGKRNISLAHDFDEISAKTRKQIFFPIDER